MREPLTTVMRLDAIACPPCNPSQGVSRARGVTTHVLFLQSPSRLYRIEIWRVRREVDDSHSFRCASGLHTPIVVRSEVVENQHISRRKFRQQTLGQPRNEALCIRSIVHRTEQTPAGHTNCAQKCEIGSPVRRGPLDVLLAFLDPGMAARHRSVQPRFVDKHQLGDRHSSDLSPNCLALLHYVWSKLLQRPDSFFLTTNPARRRARLILETIYSIIIITP